jgi:hypothetical protein
VEANSVLEFEFTPAHLRDGAGFTYRQINQWEANGVLPRRDARGRSWRRFTSREMFAILACAELRKRFDTPYAHLEWLRGQIVDSDTDHLRVCIDEMKERNTAVYLLTDFQGVLKIANDLQQAEIFDSADLRQDADRGFLILRLNGVVNRLLALAGIATALPITTDHYDALRRAAAVNVAANREEVEALALLRRTDVDRVTFLFTDGRVARAEIEKTLRGVTAAEVRSIMTAAPYQVVEVARTAEGVRSVKQKTSKILGESRKHSRETREVVRPRKRSK